MSGFKGSYKVRHLKSKAVFLVRTVNLNRNIFLPDIKEILSTDGVIQFFYTLIHFLSTCPNDY